MYDSKGVCFQEVLLVILLTTTWLAQFVKHWSAEQQPVPGSEAVESAGRENANVKIKWEETGERKGGTACNHFCKWLVPVYQLLVYPLIGQI